MSMKKRADQAKDQAQAKARSIIARQLDHIGGFSPDQVSEISTDLAEAIVRPERHPDAATARKEAYALAIALDPRTPPDHEAYAALDDLENLALDGVPFGQQVRAASQRDSWGNAYTGAGWTEEEEQKLGRQPGKWELSPGDLLHYQRRLDSHVLMSMAESVDKATEAKRPIRRPQAATASLAVSPEGFPVYSEADPDDAMTGELQKLTRTHDQAQGDPSASGLTGSNYPWHQGGGAVRDALVSHASPIGSFVQKGQAQSDVGAHLAMGTSVDPVAAAAVTYESDAHHGIPSPRGVPTGMSAEQRDARIARLRELSEKLRAPNYSHYYIYKTGKAPSYVGQGLAGAANAFSDISTFVSGGATKAVNLAANTAGKTAVPLVGAYGRHIARKTASSAAQPASRLLAQEAAGDAIPLAGMQAYGTAVDKAAPGPLQMFLPGIQNRPDLWDPDPATGFPGLKITNDNPDPQKAFRAWYEQQDQERAKALRELEAENMKHPESYARPSIGNPGAAAGEVAAEGYRNLTPPGKSTIPFLLLR